MPRVKDLRKVSERGASAHRKELSRCLSCCPITMSRLDEDLPPSVTPQEASGAGLIAAFLIFGLTLGAFFLLNAYWPAAKVITKAVPTIDRDSPSKKP